MVYGKALLTSLTRRGGDGELPDAVHELPDVSVDPAHLAAYNRVCGFRLTGELPATYSHVLGFPLQLKLMTGPGFPFPLVGLVHVANRITQARPLRVDDRLDLRVQVENLRPHRKGRQFDMVTEVFVAGEVIWTGVSTYLRRGGGGDGGQTERSGTGKPEPTAVWRVPGDIGRRYAAVSGDRNPIHLHPLTARLFGFPRPIAHGMWSKARCLAAFEGRLPAAFTIDVAFKKPVPLPARVGFAAEPADGGWEFRLFHPGKAVPHLSGTISRRP